MAGTLGKYLLHGHGEHTKSPLDENPSFGISASAPRRIAERQMSRKMDSERKFGLGNLGNFRLPVGNQKSWYIQDSDVGLYHREVTNPF